MVEILIPNFVSIHSKLITAFRFSLQSVRDHNIFFRDESIIPHSIILSSVCTYTMYSQALAEKQAITTEFINRSRSFYAKCSSSAGSNKNNTRERSFSRGKRILPGCRVKREKLAEIRAAVSNSPSTKGSLQRDEGVRCVLRIRGTLGSHGARVGNEGAWNRNVSLSWRGIRTIYRHRSSVWDARNRKAAPAASK